MRRRSLLAAALAVGALACGPRKLAPPPAPPSWPSALELIPADLDVVLRLDVKRLRDGALAGELGERVLAAVPGELHWLRDGLAGAELLVLGFRPGPDLTPRDAVLVLRGELGRVSLPEERFGIPRDLGGDVRRWEANPPPRDRTAPAVVYLRGDRDLVVGTLAEMDALARVVEEGHRDEGLRPPERGLLAAAVRASALEGAQLPGPVLRLAAQVRDATLVVDLVGSNVTAEAALRLHGEGAAEATARKLAEAGRHLTSAGLGDTRVEVAAVGGEVVVRATVGPEDLARWVGGR